MGGPAVCRRNVVAVREIAIAARSEAISRTFLREKSLKSHYYQNGQSCSLDSKPPSLSSFVLCYRVCPSLSVSIISNLLAWPRFVPPERSATSRPAGHWVARASEFTVTGHAWQSVLCGTWVVVGGFTGKTTTTISSTSWRVFPWKSHITAHDWSDPLSCNVLIGPFTRC